MIDFNEVWDNDGFLSSCSRADAEHFYNAGQQSKIDELQKQVITQGQNFNDQAQKLKDTEYFNQKLQARVDEVIKYIEPSDELSHKAYRDLIKILKGNKNEN